MSLEICKTERLLELAKKIAGITWDGETDHTDKEPLYMYNNRTGNWDDIWFFPENKGMGTKPPSAKVAFVNLSAETRMQLDQTMNKDRRYQGRSEHIYTTHHRTALFKYIHKSVETNLESIKISK